MLLSKIIKTLDDWCPPCDAEEFDNVGLLVGELQSEITKAVITLDITDDIIDECISVEANLIISFHPLFIVDPKTNDMDDRINKYIIRCLNDNINVYCIHTNLDNNSLGTSYQLGKILNIKNQSILINNENNKLKGIGTIGIMNRSMNDYDFLEFLKEKLNLKYLRHSKLINKKIKKIAMLSGSGSFAIDYAILKKADCFISADFKYHDFFKPNKKILIIDIGHYESERHIKETILNYLNKKIPKFACIIAKSKTNPVNYF
ncbi:MAG: Nif3-like dinuclear metal center hexameric protein [Cryomorphaceae bacterium]|nr:MAG: Nif3-like dinuclear metal center hexameric protein [Cryomorphaceae bacterium]